MSFKNKRNSRDDKSAKSPRPPKPVPGSAGKNNPYRSDRTEGTNNTKKKLFGEDFRNSGSFDKRRSRGFGKAEESDKNRSFDKGVRSPGRSAADRTGERSAPVKKFGDKPFRPRSKEQKISSGRPKYRSDDRKWTSEERFVNKRAKKPAASNEAEQIRLNRFIANAGICSRRKADELISAGVISVNGEPVTELGFKVHPARDVVRYNGETLRREKMVYVLLNKPKDYITTTDDPQERKTVMSLVEKASRERIYPVGRLDRNTTGLLLMTNDGDLADKLSHPKNNVTKLYNVELNKNLTQGDLNKIAFGIELEDGFIKPDQVSYVTGGSKREVGIQIHSGKNRVVRRIFESLGYEVVKLDRVVYSNLTKKDLPRGRWRYLEEKEVIQLKRLS